MIDKLKEAIFLITGGVGLLIAVVLAVVVIALICITIPITLAVCLVGAPFVILTRTLCKKRSGE